MHHVLMILNVKYWVNWVRRHRDDISSVLNNKELTTTQVKHIVIRLTLLLNSEWYLFLYPGIRSPGLFQIQMFNRQSLNTKLSCTYLDERFLWATLQKFKFGFWQNTLRAKNSVLHCLAVRKWELMAQLLSHNLGLC